MNSNHCRANTQRKELRLCFLKFTVVFSLIFLNGCTLFQPNVTDAINCATSSSSCHSGRFGLVWQTQTNSGQKNDSVTGTYNWKSGFIGTNEAIPVATLEVNSTLGPNLGKAQRKGNYFEVRAADGRVYVANDWQKLFDLIFPVKLPAQALVSWMQNPRKTNLPPLPENWSWENRNNKYRIRFVEPGTEGRIDLIPQ